jgi:hypothetical protein
MPFTHQFKPTHKEIKRYYEELTDYATHEVSKAQRALPPKTSSPPPAKKPIGISSLN